MRRWLGLALSAAAAIVLVPAIRHGLDEPPLTCPAGATRVEARPPAGPEAWCERAGRREGPYRAWYPKGRLKIEGAYAEGKKAGRWTYWHGNGILGGRGQRKEEGEYRDGKEHGPWTRWHALGPRLEAGPYVDGRREGRWTTWSEIGVKLAEGEYREDREIGAWLRWSARGEPCRPAGPGGA
jgi:hypothetical protein